MLAIGKGFAAWMSIISMGSSSVGAVSEHPVSGYAKIEIEGEKSCPAFELALFSVDGDFDDAYRKYSSGASFWIKGGSHHLQYQCLPNSAESPQCLYAIDNSQPLKNESLSVRPNEHWNLRCSDKGDLYAHKSD
jgi:hypothetical protein